MFRRSMVSAFALIGVAHAQEAPRAATPVSAAPAADRVFYDAAFFARFAPQNALDMVKQTPGFSLDAGQSQTRRGFSGAVGNVLIDGARPIAKSQTLSTILSSIPASQVVRTTPRGGTRISLTCGRFPCMISLSTAAAR